METNIRYKTLPVDKAPHGHKYQLNKWYKEDAISICEKGFHCSKNIIDAMGYVTPGYVAVVEVRGDSIAESDKEVWSEMRIIQWKKWTKKNSVGLSIYAAELVLKNYEDKYPNDFRPREAIEAAKKVLKKDKDTASSRFAAESAESAARSARSAARYAMRSAARSTESAAEYAARSTAWSAWSAESSESAWSAARYAMRSVEYTARSARSAARSAIFQKCHQKVLEISGLNT